MRAGQHDRGPAPLCRATTSIWSGSRLWAAEGRWWSSPPSRCRGRRRPPPPWPSAPSAPSVRSCRTPRWTPSRSNACCCARARSPHDPDAHRQDIPARRTRHRPAGAPLPVAEAELAAELAHFPAAANVRWVQEEPESEGAWSLVTPRLHRSAGHPVACVSRTEAPAPRSAPPSGTPWSREPSGHRSPGEQRRFQQGSAAPEYPPTARQHRGGAAS
ncbi:hypothetical protein [Streptomyces sp. NPDC048665]|uniref:hypothetical protein n=1 Tax=Streptomyces sp. NPDC048665 TaxID=3155490 RepID=UPI00342FB8A5